MDDYSAKEIKIKKKKRLGHIPLMTNWILTLCIHVFEVLLTPASIVHLL